MRAGRFKPRPVTRLVETGQGEGLAGRGAPATGRSDPAAAALAALLALLAAGRLGAHAGPALNQLLHLAELLDELADVGRWGAAAAGDAQAAGPVDDGRVVGLVTRHRGDDAPHPF